ncbi:MAG: hypothetical protein R2716_13770 [Microthrixaceae bacterium]
MTPGDSSGSSMTGATAQSSQYRPPTSSPSATKPAHTEVAAPWGTDFHSSSRAPRASSSAAIESSVR